MSQLLRDICESRLQLTEVRGERSGVLGVVEGVFFVPESPSRNGRIYPRALWERVLRSEDLRRLLENRLLIGTVGHEDVDFDALIREQKVSHVVTDLWIGEDGKGYGRAEILDTPVGRILYTLLKNGSKLAVSSKGWGEYKGATSDGLYVVDEGSYILERFDFVVDPGFIEAVPGLKRQYESLIGEKKIESANKKEGGRMQEVEKVLEEKIRLQERVSELLQEVNRLKEENERLVREKEKLEKEKKEIEEKAKKEIAESKKKELREVSEKKKLYETYLGVSEEKEVEGEIKLLAKLIEKRAEELVEAGVPKERLEGESLAEVLTRVFMEEDRLVTREKVRMKSIMESRIERYKKLLREAKGVISTVNAMGGLDKISESLRKARKIIKAITEKKLEEEVERLSARYGANKERVRALIEKAGVKEAEEILRAKHRDVSESRKIVRVEEDREVIKESLAGRIMSTLSFGLKENKEER